jgi:hypothetical protein
VGFFFGVQMLPILFSALTLGAPAPTEAQSNLLIEPCKTFEIYAFSKTDCLVKLFNAGKKPIHISHLQADGAEDALPSADEIIQPGSEKFLTIGFAAGNAVGATYHTYHLATDESPNTRMFGIRAFVLTAFDENKPTLDLGIVDTTAQRSVKPLEIHTQEVAHWQIKKVLESPLWLDVKVNPQNHGIEASVKPNSSWGQQSGFIKLAVDVPQQRELWVWAKADVRGNVVPAANPFDTGLLRFGNHNEFKLELSNRSGKSFGITNLRLQDIVGDVVTTPCIPVRTGCELVRLTVSDQQPAGSIRGYIQMTLPDYNQELAVLVTGLIIDPKKKVIDLNSPEARATVNSAPTSNGGNSFDLTHEIQTAVKEADAIPPGAGPLLKWKVANGGGIHGFQIFRSDDEVGPFVLVNRETVRSSTLSDESQEYQYRDNSAVAGKTYWYYIGIVYADGHKQQLSGAQKVVAK